MGVVMLMVSLAAMYFMSTGLVYGVWPGPVPGPIAVFYRPANWLFDKSEAYASFVRWQLDAVVQPDPRGPICRIIVTDDGASNKELKATS